MSEPKGQVICGTLVLISPKGAQAQDVERTVAAAKKAHKGPVLALPFGWKAADIATTRKMLDEVEAAAIAAGGKPDAKIGQANLGTSKPPPPPPPPPAAPAKDA